MASPDNPFGSIEFKAWKDLVSIQDSYVRNQETLNRYAKEHGKSVAQVRQLSKDLTTEYQNQAKELSKLNKAGRLLAKYFNDNSRSAQLMESRVTRFVASGTKGFRTVEKEIKKSEDRLRSAAGAFDVLRSRFESELTINVETKEAKDKLANLKKEHEKISDALAKDGRIRNSKGQFISKDAAKASQLGMENEMKAIKREMAGQRMEAFLQTGIGKVVGEVGSSVASMRKTGGLLKAAGGFLGPVAIIGTALTGVYKLLTGGARRLLELQDVTNQVRRNFGYTRIEAEYFFDYVDKTRERFSALGLTSGDVAQNMVEIRNSVGDFFTATKQEVDLINELNARLGLSASTSASVFNLMAMVGSETREADAAALSFAKTLSSRGGVSFNRVMEDVAGNAEAIVTSFRSSNIEILDASVRARQLGLDIGRIASVTESLLDFESSIRNELEAEVLLGRQLNLNGLRRAAFAGDAVGVTEELARLTREIGNVDQLNIFQKKAIANATGLNVAELDRAFTIQTKLNSMTTEQQMAYESLSAEMKSRINMNAEDLGIEIKRVRMMSDLQNTIQQIRSRFDAIFGTIYRSVQPIFRRLFDAIDRQWVKIDSIFERLGNRMSNFMERVVNGDVAAKIERIFSWGETLITKIGNFALDVSDFIGVDTSGIRSAFGSGSSGSQTTSGLNPAFRTSFQEMQAAAALAGHTIGINSGYRTAAQQQKLFNELGAGRASRPENSLHVRGTAIDMTGNDAARAWVKNNAHLFGLSVPHASEPWHVEMANDALIRPQHRQIVKFHPNDTITAVQNPNNNANEAQLKQAIQTLNGILNELKENGIAAYIGQKDLTTGIASYNRI